MWNRIERLSEPASEALTLDEVKLAARIDGSDEDAFFERAIKAARQLVEGPDGAGLALLASSWRLSLDRFPGEIRIPMGPVLSIDAISYVDEAGDTQTLAASGYQWRKGRFEARIAPAYSLTWPTTRRQYDAVLVDFTAGFPGTDEDPVDFSRIPQPLMTAMLMLITHWHRNRETVTLGQAPAEVTHGYQSLLDAYRVGRFA